MKRHVLMVCFVALTATQVMACAANPSRFAQTDEAETADVTPAEEATEGTAPAESAHTTHGTPHVNPDAPHKHDHEFKNPEQWAERWNAADRDEWQRPNEVIAIMGIGAGQTVADLGTGTGYFVPHLTKAVGPSGRVLALDLSQEMVDYVQRTATLEGWGNVQARKVEANDPGLMPNSVDAILTVNTWHHISNREDYARKLYSALKPGGKVVVVDYTRDAPNGPPPAMRLAPEVVTAELGAVGFITSVKDESLPKQYVVVGARP